MAFGDIATRGTPTDIRQVMNYIYQLEDQLRYALSHIDGENISAGSIGKTQIAQGAIGRQQIADGAVSDQKVQENTITKDKLGRDVLETMDQKIIDAQTKQLTSAAFANKVNGLIEDADIDWEKIKKAGEPALFTASGDGVALLRLRLTNANIAALPAGQVIVKGADGQLYAVTPSGANAYRAGTDAISDGAITTEKLAQGAVTAEKLGADAAQDMAEKLPAAVFFAREDVIAAVKQLAGVVE